MRAVILAGGQGTRLRPITSVLPKPLIPLGDKPILEILLNQLKRDGYSHVTLAVGYLSHLIKATFGQGENLGIKLDYSEQTTPLGTAGPLSLVQDLKDDFLVLNGDLLTNLSFKKIMRFHKKSKADVTVGVYERQEKIELGILEIKYGRIKKYIEKPEYNFNISSGIYVLNKKVLENLNYNKYCDFPTLISKLIKSNKRLLAYKFDDYWLDLGRPDDYYKACEIFEQNPEIFLPELKRARAKAPKKPLIKVKQASNLDAKAKNFGNRL